MILFVSLCSLLVACCLLCRVTIAVCGFSLLNAVVCCRLLVVVRCVVNVCSLFDVRCMLVPKTCSLFVARCVLSVV